jgi:hypothetical protein
VKTDKKVWKKSAAKPGAKYISSQAALSRGGGFVEKGYSGSHQRRFE